MYQKGYIVFFWKSTDTKNKVEVVNNNYDYLY